MAHVPRVMRHSAFSPTEDRVRLVNADYGRHSDIHEHLLQFLRGDFGLKRALTILKARGSMTHPRASMRSQPTVSSSVTTSTATKT